MANSALKTSLSRVSTAQGKAISSKNITIAVNKILDELDNRNGYGDSRPQDDTWGLHEDQASSDNMVVKRLDRRDRSSIVQDACSLHGDMDANSFKQSCHRLRIPAVTYTYLLNVLRRNETTLNLRNHGLSPSAVVSIKNTLLETENSRVLEIDLSSNKLSNEGTVAICQYLTSNDSVTKVNLSQNEIRKPGLDAISEMLPQNDCLKHLVLSRNQITGDDFKSMAESLHDELVLERLDLSANSFSPTSGYIFGFLFARNISLVHVDLSCNHIGDEGTRNLVPGLIQNRTIRVLHISWNDVSDEGARWLAELLTSNTVLRTLNISYNNICSKGTNHISESLASNTTLSDLDLSGNSLRSMDAVQVLENILRNHSTQLRNLRLGEVLVSRTFENIYQELRKKHPHFTVSGLVGAAGQPVQMTPASKGMLALEQYFETNKFDSSVFHIY